MTTNLARPAAVTSRIIHTVPAVTQEASGPSYSVMRLCEALREQGRNVTLAALSWSPGGRAAPWLHEFPLGRGPRRLGRSPAMRQWLLAQARAGDVALLHTHSLWMMPNVYPGRIGRRSGIPLVVSPRGTLARHAMQIGSPVKRVFWPLVQRPALREAVCFHATAESECQDIRRAGFRQPIAIIPNGVDVPPARQRRDRSVRTLLYLGRLHRIKGLDRLFRAWSALHVRFPDWRVRLVGPDDGGYRQVLERLATSLRLPRIVFDGPLYGDAKWQAYADADLFVLPTHSENFGMSVAEALASGTPAVVSRGAPWPGLNLHRSGWWIETGDEPLIAALEEALGSSAHTLDEMGQRARTWMAADFAWDRIAARMSTTYEWILSGGSPPAWVHVR